MNYLQQKRVLFLWNHGLKIGHTSNKTLKELFVLLNSIKSGVCDVKLQTIDCHYFQKHSTLHSLRMETGSYTKGHSELFVRTFEFAPREREGESLALL